MPSPPQGHPTLEEVQRWYSSSYTEARAKFCSVAKDGGARLVSHPIENQFAPDGSPLSIDIAYFGSPTDHVLYVSSGAHGVEGFFGSAVQIAIAEGFSGRLNDTSSDFHKSLVASTRPPAHGCLALVHAINPYGMAWLRRCSKEDVDLNRNALFEEGAFEVMKDVNRENYSALNSFIHPSTPYYGESWIPFFRPLLFMMKCVFYTISLGYVAVKQAVCQGQYFQKESLYFGGTELTENLKILGREIESVHPKSSAFLDLHSGLGPWKEMVISSNKQSKLAPYLSAPVELDDKPDVMFTSSGNVSFGLHSKSKAEWHDLLLEVGTYSGYRVLRAMINEMHYSKQCRRNGVTRDLLHPTVIELSEVFNPKNTEWRRDAVQLSGKHISEAAAGFWSQEFGN